MKTVLEEITGSWAISTGFVFVSGSSDSKDSSHGCDSKGEGDCEKEGEAEKGGFGEAEGVGEDADKVCISKKKPLPDSLTSPIFILPKVSVRDFTKSLKPLFLSADGA